MPALRNSTGSMPVNIIMFPEVIDSTGNLVVYFILLKNSTTNLDSTCCDPINSTEISFLLYMEPIISSGKIFSILDLVTNSDGIIETDFNRLYDSTGSFLV